ncbi:MULTISPECIES: iron ABC transporter permease [unclassified Leucobacter]|uniref:ABC transporter permease n=1 Tax=unclassified Leucobacter TaxID=2621730 RepID=UPI00165D9575|nr:MULTISPECIES: iron ABC transporter permease [unclassified Leucobacter]MBC9937265.1 iron ABC transporter permease [Leucobacter sp. cx-87]
MNRSPRVRRRARHVRRWPLGSVIAWGAAVLVPLAFLFVFFVWPVVALVSTGFLGGVGGRAGGIDLSGLTEVLGSARTWRALGQTLAQAAAGTALSVVLGVPAAFVLYRLRFRGRAALRGLLTVPFVLPTVVVAVAFRAVFGPGGPLAFLDIDGSFVIIVLALAFFNVTVVMRTVGGFWAQLDARPEQAASCLGASPARVWWTVTLPALTPAIASAAALVFLFCATSFGIVLVLGGREFQTIETEIYRLTVQYLDLRGAAVLSILQLVIVAAAIAVSARLRSGRERAAAMRPAAARIRRTHLPVLAVFAVTILVLHMLPIGSLVLRSLRTVDGAWTLEHYHNLVVPPPDSPLSGSVLDSAWLSIRLALVAALIAVVLGVLVALVVSRRPRSRALRRGIHAFDGAVMLPIGVSAVTVGFGLLLTMHRPLGIGIDLRSSIVLIPVAQALIALPLVVRTIAPVLRAIDPRLRDAAATLGADGWRVLRTIDLPVAGRALGLAVGFAFAASLGEFGATAFLVRPDAQTLPVVIAQLISRQGVENYEAAIAASVLLGALTAGVMLVAERLRGDWAGEI